MHSSMACQKALAVRWPALYGHPAGFIDGFSHALDTLLTCQDPGIRCQLCYVSDPLTLKDVDIDLKKMKQEVGSRHLLPKVAERKPH